MRASNNAIVLSVVSGLALSATALASPTSVMWGDLAHCDPMIFGPTIVDELGTDAAVFPGPCLVFADAKPTTDSACPMSDIPGIDNAEVRLLNLTGREFSDLWYAGENGTGFTNFDGLINGMESFKIDAVGGNRPLIAESMTPDGIFEVGEAWTFIIDDYTNVFGFGAGDFVSLGVPSGGGAVSLSSGSIVAVEVPTPGALALLGLGGVVAGRRRRR